MSTPTTFTIRTKPLPPTDPPFILAAFDSALPHLSRTGSAAQWGTEPRSTNPKFIARIRDLVDAAAREGGDAADAVFVAEVELDDGEGGVDPEVAALARRDEGSGRMMLPVAAAITESAFPAYVSERPHLAAKVKTVVEGGEYIYLSVMVSDFRTGALRKGAGAALVRRVGGYAKEKGKRGVYADCWGGNGGGLVGFYEKHGFVVEDRFEVEKEGGEVWEGALLRMDV
ncbi:hypothetical protein VE03_10119 [Pseudogymnoascus sp. 23342-1-I1]|nr:hypothetical protein VE03_10119 [Pseudogymnoascus sp. 23342-1-I1]